MTNVTINDNKDNAFFGENESQANAPLGESVGNGVFGRSKVPNASGVVGENNNGGTGVAGFSKTWRGVYGHSDENAGVVGESQSFDGVWGESHSAENAGVSGHNNTGGYGVRGDTDGGTGVAGFSKTWRGVYGHSDSNAGIVGESKGFDGVFGISHSDRNAGVSGHNQIGDITAYKARKFERSAYGVWGDSDHGTGVAGFSETWRGVYGHSDSNAGIVGESKGFDGVWGISHSKKNAGVSGHNDQGGLAGFFDGNVEVTGDIRLMNADCAEDFDIFGEEPIEPGTVMVVGEEGAMHQSQRAYDKCVAGVISGAGGYKPGIVLDKQQSQSNRKPIALLGKVFCKVDARFAAVEVGDLLTTSDTPGHAMKAVDPLRAFGAVIGKALRPLRDGQELIPILIALQ